MAEIINIGSNDMPLSKTVKVDLEIIEYIYASNINDMLEDDDLMKLIVSNGYYKSAFCESAGVEMMNIIVDDIEHMLISTPKNIPSTLELVKGETDCNIIGIKLLNE